MLKLHFITSGNMTINLEGLKLGDHQKDPILNCKSYLTEPNEIILNAKDIKNFTDWGCIEIEPTKEVKQRVINVTIDADVWGCYATAQVLLEKDGHIVFNDNFQSGTKGPIGNPRRYKSYPVLEF